MDKRPALQNMLEDIKNGKLQEVWVWKTDRLSRKLADLIQMIEFFNRYKVTFRSISEKDFDPSTSSRKA
ncbi:site-specific recombinase, DNA invertase Pin [Paenibacillus sp. FSL H7-689]|nr:site-specific recombinase, DNA invertase Pin [Paenibacillus sp. FSL H7-689]